MRSRILLALQGAVLGIALYAICSLFVTFLVFAQIEAFAIDLPPGMTPGDGSPMTAVILVAIAALALAGVLELLRRSPGTPALAKLVSAGLLVGGTLAGAALSIPAWSVTGRSALAGELAALEAEGLAPPPPTLSPKPPDQENAVVLLLEAQEKYEKALPEEFLTDPAYTAVQAALDRFAGSATTGAELEAALPLLETHREALDLVMRAADRKAAWWDLDLGGDTPVVLATLPEHIHLVPLSRLLALRAIRESQDGDTAAAARSIDAVLAMGDALEASPFLFSAVVRAATLSAALPAASRIFDTAPELAVAKETWGKRVRPEPLLDHVKTAYRFELVSVPREIASGRLGSPAESLGSTGPAATFFGGAFYYGLRTALHRQRPLLTIAMADTLPHPSPRMLARTGRAAAELAVARGAIAWSTEQAAGGAVLGKDPWNAGPLKALAVAASNGTLVYSVGPDGKDDGGAAFDPEEMTGDISWLIHDVASK